MDEKLEKIKPIIEFIEENKYSKKFLVIIGNTSLYLQGVITAEPSDYDILIYSGDRYKNDMLSGRVDCVLSELAILEKLYFSRCVEYVTFKGIRILLLSKEDVIINKISGFHLLKHKNNISKDIGKIDLNKVLELLEEVKKQEFIVIRDELFRKNIDDFIYHYSASKITKIVRSVKKFLTPTKKEITIV